MPLQKPLKTGDGDLQLVTELSLLTRWAELSHAICRAALICRACSWSSTLTKSITGVESQWRDHIICFKPV